MTDVTQEMILEYIQRKGGVVKNVDLVRHFRKHLQVDDPKLKDRAREVFKERVNSVAFIKADHGDKYLHLRPEFQIKLSQPPPGHIPNGQRASITSSEDPFSPRTPIHNQRDSSYSQRDSSYSRRDSSHSQRDYYRRESSQYNDLHSPPITSPPASKTITSLKEPASNNVAGITSNSSAVLSSYKSRNSPPPSSGSLFSPPSSSKPASSGSVFSPPSSSKPALSMDSDFGSALLAEFGLLTGSDTTSSISGQTGLPSSGVSFSTQQTGLSSSSVNSPARQTGLSSSGVTSPSRQTGLSSSSVNSPARQTSLSSSGVASPARQTGLSSSSVNSPGRQTGLSSSTISSSTQPAGSKPSALPGSMPSVPLDSAPSRPSAPTSSVGAYTSSSSNNTVNQTRKTSQSSLTSSSAIKSVSQASDRASSGYGSLGKATDSSKTTVTSSSAQSSKPASSFFDDIESMFSGLDSSLSMFSSDLSSTVPASSSSLLSDSHKSTPSVSTASNYSTPFDSYKNTPSVTLPSSNGPSDSHKSTPSVAVSSSNGPSSYNSTSPNRTSTGYSHNSPSPKTSTTSGPTSTSESPTRKAHLTSVLGYSNSSPPPKSPGPVAPKPVRNSTSAISSTPTTDMAQNRPVSSAASGLTNGSADVKQVTSRRPPPAPSPTPKRPAPKPPTRSSSILDKSKSNSLGRQASAHRAQEQSGPSTLGRASGKGHSSEVKGGDPGQGLGSIGLDFLSSFGSFATSAGTSLDPMSPPSQPPLASQASQPAHSTPPHSPSRHSGLYNTGRPRAHTEENPMIRVDTPTKGSDTLSYTSGRASPLGAYDSGRGRSPTYTALGPRPYGHDSSSEQLNSGPRTHHDSNERIHSGVVLRNKPPSNAPPSARRSRNFDKAGNLDGKTRHMIMSTPPTGRRATHLAPPEVAPKPHSHSHEVASLRSAEDYGDEESGSLVANSEPDYWDIDPYEKEWMLANAESRMETIHRLFMTEPSLVNRGDFIHGYTAMHWAAKHGRCDLISALVMNGAMVNLKSNGGLTPLHMAAASGHDNAIQFLVQEYKADVNARDHGGRRPVDILNPKCGDKTKIVLSRIDNHGLPLPTMHWVENLSSFSRPRTGTNLNRTWSSVGDIDRRHAIDTLKRHKSPKSIRKSFSFKRTRITREPTSPTRKEKKEKKRREKESRRPVSDAHAYSIQRGRYDV